MKLLLGLAPAVFLLLWSGGFTIAKVGLSYADPLTLLAFRYGCVVALLFPFCVIYKPALPRGRAEWLHLVFVGFLIQVVYFGTGWMAFVKGSSAGSLALITSLQPILVALLMPLVSSERVSVTRWVGLVLGLVGTFLVLYGNLGIQPISVTVLLFSVSALLAFTLATVWEKRFGVSHHPLTSNMVQYVVGFLCTLPLALLFEPMNVTITPAFIGALAYLVLGNSILAISLLLMMIRKGEATRVSALFFLVPPTAALIAWLVMDEKMTPLAWGGMAVAAFGVRLATRRPKPSSSQ
ncbi:MAG: drug/metabolite transporter (DMT)-like permease [Granulosicoccus sp.]|jgi:drug/metabolite transporter (DMT)-like permease